MMSISDEINFESYLPEIVGLPIKKVVANLMMGAYDKVKTDILVRFIVKSDYRFSFDDELTGLRKNIPFDNRGLSFAHAFAERGYVFDLSDLLTLKDLRDNFVRIVAHFMVNEGYRFTFDELMKLGNPADKYGRTLAHDMVSWGHFFSVIELIKLGNPADKYGRTPAHQMAERGYQFTLEDLKKLPYAENNAWKKVSEVKPHPSYTDPYWAIGGFRRWKAFHEQMTVQLTFRNNEPIFEKNHNFGRIAYFTFGDFDLHEPFNLFEIKLEQNETGWVVKLGDNDKMEDRYNHFYQKCRILELTEKLNQTLLNQQTMVFPELKDGIPDIRIEYGLHISG